MLPSSYYVFLSAFVFSVGLYGVLTRTNAVVILMCVELMLNAGNLNLIAFAAHHGGVAGIAGQTFTLFVLAVAAAEVAVGLGIFILVYRRYGTVDVRKPRLMRW
ncbi:MAG: NADH:ubiquinone oxidoreductase subunit K [Methanobacteriota archaeon]|jgi:NADH:ubiquinone oxidoreductase subunit K